MKDFANKDLGNVTVNGDKLSNQDIVTALSGNSVKYTFGEDDDESVRTYAKKNTFIFGEKFGDDNEIVSANEGADTLKFTKSDASEFLYELDGQELSISTDSSFLTYTNSDLSKLTITDAAKHSFKVNVADTKTPVDYTKSKNDTITFLGNNAVKYQDGKKDDIVIGSKTSTTYNFSNGGEDVVYGGTGNDVYNVDLTKNSLIISDTSGADKLNLDIINKEDLALFFDVDKTSGRVDTDLVIVNRNDMSKYVTISDYFGTGKIEKVTDGTNTYDVTSAVDEIISNVQSWLGNHGFDSAEAVLEQGNQYDINSLMACYAKTDMSFVQSQSQAL